jgi:VanZ family protein
MHQSEIASRLVGSVWLRRVGVICVVAIVILPLTPGDLQVRTGLPGLLEHIVAYGITAIAITMGARSHRFPGVIIATLAAFSGVMEALQVWSPGREPELMGFLSSSLGAATGAFLAYVVRGRIEASPVQ